MCILYFGHGSMSFHQVIALWWNFMGHCGYRLCNKKQCRVNSVNINMQPNMAAEARWINMNILFTSRKLPSIPDDTDQ